MTKSACGKKPPMVTRKRNRISQLVIDTQRRGDDFPPGDFVVVVAVG
jgi:hypothetical protein